ncbi:DUF3429 domain-containing protein [Vibrio superstes]|uniref:DUF3429 domain-containing protein n=1 Tax=Vibrio superstes NBRC 103154 TaxID=1219062 RepID=A0A511QP46_9VIBR|nr:DUF3429 domain-containing protein [Vibrio superstes]GEM79111.1 hypothetical protein VSU01S_13560 [Vibrio superstes NBRC 103154]
MIYILGYMGLVPFILLPVLFGLTHSQASFHFIMSFLIYSAGIALFMAGAVWGRCVDRTVPEKRSLVASNVITLGVIALGLFVFYSPMVLLIGIGLAHGLNLYFEPKRDHPRYLKLRFILTGVVLTAHLCMLALIVI